MLRETITTPSLQAQASTKTESPGVSSAVSTASEGAHQDDPAHTAEESGAEAHAKEASHAKFVPIFRPGTADINTTVALGFITMLSVQVWGVSYLGLSYFKKFFNFANPMTFFVGILELISDISKILSFAFRLFGNIFAGEVLLVVMTALVPLVVPMVFYGLEVFVGAIQALVFSLLSLVFYQMATVSHEEHN